jgi:hypothetical protein
MTPDPASLSADGADVAAFCIVTIITIVLVTEHALRTWRGGP